jgi:hypothetical protein
MPDQFDLEALVRGARPEPDSRWTGRLDRRVAEGFPKPPRWYRWESVRRVVPVAGAAASVLVVLALLIGAASQSGGGDDSASSGGSSVAAPKSAPDVGTPTGSAGSAGAVTPQRDVIRSVSMTLSTTRADVEDVSDRVIRVADTLGGYVQNSSITARQSADITLRIPSAKLQDALTRLSRLAHVRSRTQEAQDVTDQRAALDARVRDARAYRDSLRNRLARATTDREASSLRGRLARAERTLRARERDVAQLARETSYATVDVRVRGDRASGAAAAPADRWTPGDALHDAGRVLEVIAGIALIALAIVVPLAVLAAAAALVGRILTRRRRERALELA